MNKTRVLITGATGFIGKPLRKMLISEGYEILALARNAPIQQDQIKWLEADLSNTQAYRSAIAEFSPEVVIHLAWQGIPDYSLETSIANLNLSLGLLSFVVSLESCKKVIVSGSCWEYADANGECLESDVNKPQNDFTWAKHAIRSWLEIHCPKHGIDYAWLRIFYVYGPGQRSGSLLPLILASLQEDEMPAINAAYNANDYVYIDDVVEAFMVAVRQPFQSGIYNIGSGESVKVLDIFRLAENIVNGSETLSEQMADNASVQVNAVDFWAGLAKVRKHLGWMPKTSLTDGISKTWAHLRAQSVL